MKILAIIQARMGSTRLPNKVMMRINHVPMIELLINRLSKSKHINQIVLATSDNDNNLSLVNHVEDLGYEVFLGDAEELNEMVYSAHSSSLPTPDNISNSDEKFTDSDNSYTAYRPPSS